MSFDSDDLRLAGLFRGQAKNSNLDLEFDDYSIKDPIDSQNVPYIKLKIKEKIKQSSIVMCLIGRSTRCSEWVAWELETGHDLGRCLIGVRLHSDRCDIPPKPLIDHSAAVVNWNIQDIGSAIDGC